MTKTLLIATRNKDKVREISVKLEPLGVEIKSLLDFPEMPEVVEDRDTLEGNALKKAEKGFKFTGIPALADDTGLEVDALNGAPGVYSSRYAGKDVTYADNRKKLLLEMRNIPEGKRQAAFSTAAVIYDSEGYEVVEGKCEGVITFTEHGEDGFGYDPVFLIPEYDQTFAEMPLELKNEISHRGIAFAKVIEVIKKRWGL